MFGFDKISLTLSSNPFLLVLGFILLALYTFYIYRFTIPNIPLFKKIILIVLRSLAILILIFILFEPVVNFAKKIVIEPVNLIFVDNSRSIQIKDGTNREEAEKDFLSKLKSNKLSGNSELFSFGTDIKPVAFDSLSKFSFSEGSTNFSKIFSDANKSGKDISTITIVSDGVITEGADPLFTAEKLNIPVYTIGIGDSSHKKDVELKNVLYNELIYAQTNTTILATITNTGFANKNVSAALFENGTLQDKKNITLSPEGIQSVSLNYNPKSGGEKKLTLSVSNLAGEFTSANNKKIFYINVLSSKIKVLLIGGAPSPDLAFIKNTLTEDKNLTVNSITQVTRDRFLENNNREKLIDSADVIFLIGFPAKDSPENLYSKIRSAIAQNNKPVFLLFSNSTDFTRLKLLENNLPFTSSEQAAYRKGTNSENTYEVQPDIPFDQADSPVLQNNSSNIIAAWNNLPPVLQPDITFNIKPESEILSKVTINNVPVNRPLILTRKLGSKRSIAVLAMNIWKWKLQTVPKELNLFDNFILNSVKWLNTKEERKQVTIRTTKKIYSQGEKIVFSAQVYDESFNPVTNAEINVAVKNQSENFNVAMNALGNGLYEGILETNKTGDYTFTGTALQNGKKIGSDSGNFNIGEIDIEMVNPRMNYEFLKSLSTQTGGEFFTPANYDQFFEVLNRIQDRSAKEKIETSEISLWSDEWLMAAAILLFGVEWFLRKRFGML